MIYYFKYFVNSCNFMAEITFFKITYALYLALSAFYLVSRKSMKIWILFIKIHSLRKMNRIDYNSVLMRSYASLPYAFMDLKIYQTKSIKITV